jgi:hypothetical protein
MPGEMRLLLCGDPLQPRLPDSAFEAEVAAIQRLGLPFDLLDFEALDVGAGERATRRISEGFSDLVYRGWMLPSERYADLVAAVGSRGSSLLTSPREYTATHHLPAAYKGIESLTPKTVWVTGQAPFDFGAIHRAISVFGHEPIIVKDYVKSRKHEWLEACFIPAADDRAAVERVVGRFIELQGADLAGGLVFRQFVPLERVGQHAQSGLPLGREYRLFFVDRRLLIGGRYWDGVDYPDDYPIEPFTDIAAAIDSPFFSMDIARTAAGEWIVMEVGDGQVAGIPESISPMDFYGRLSTAVAQMRRQ